MEPRVRVRPLSSKQLLGSALSHAIVTDCPFEQGGRDIGFTSGEMLRLAIGAEAIRNAVLSGSVTSRVKLGLKIDVGFSLMALSQDK